MENIQSLNQITLVQKNLEILEIRLHIDSCFNLASSSSENVPPATGYFCRLSIKHDARSIIVYYEPCMIYRILRTMLPLRLITITIWLIPATIPFRFIGQRFKWYYSKFRRLICIINLLA